MTMLASPEDRRAIKDSRGKCRSRWRDITREIIRRYRGHFSACPRIGTRLVHGENADADCPRIGCERGQFMSVDVDCSWARQFARTEHGQSTDAAAVMASDYSRTRTVPDVECARPRKNCGRGCGHGLDTDCPWLRTSARSMARTVAISPRLFHGLKSLGLPRGNACVRRKPVGCTRANASPLRIR